MKKVVFAIIIMLAAGAHSVHAEDSFEQVIDSDSQVMYEEYTFEQVSDHCYFLTIEENGENIAIVSTTQGILMFDPPPEPDLTATMEALEILAGRPVRWIINTGLYASRTAGVDLYARQGALLLTSYRQQSSKVFEPEPIEEPEPEPDGFGFFNDPDDIFFPFPDPVETGMEDPEFPDNATPAFPEFTFKNRMYLFPEDVEIQIRALPHEARTDADLFAYVPDEKVLFTGRLFEPGHYPDIDITAGGSALKWIDALEMVIDSVPLLISAIPPEEPEEEGEEELTEDEALLDAGLLEGEEEEEKSLEEYITVISARGEPANLMDMKDLLNMSKKLRNDISRAIKAGRTCDSYLDSPATNTYLEYGNFFTYANHLCQELSPEEELEEELETVEE